MDLSDMKQTTITGTILNAESIMISYRTLPGSRPHDFGNFVALWPDTQIPWNALTKYLKKIDLPSNETSDDVVMQDLSLNNIPYILGLGTGKALTTICASATFTPASGPDRPTLFASQLSLVVARPHFVTVSYVTAIGNTPEQNGNWLGIWEGQAVTWDGTARLQKVWVRGNDSSGSQSLSNLSLKAGTMYTVGYATDRQDINIAMSVTFCLPTPGCFPHAGDVNRGCQVAQE